MTKYKKTKSVKLLLNVFDKSKEALSVVDLIKMFKFEMNKTTVYRVLDRLEENGFLHSFTGKDGLKWYAKCGDQVTTIQRSSHPHFQCQVCGKTECLPMNTDIPAVPNYKVVTANLLLTGHCKDCTI